MRKIIFIVQQLSQPRCIRRIESVVEAGFEYKVYGFDNDLYSKNLENIKFDIELAYKIGKKKSKLSKLTAYFRLIRRAVKESDTNDIVHVFGFELATMLSFYRPLNYIYEEADVFAARINNSVFRSLLILVDKRIIRKSRLTIFTSKGFLDYLFPQNHTIVSKILLLPNKLHNSFSNTDRPGLKEINISRINFGFIGLIRYPDTIIRFAEVIASRFTNHFFHFFGDGPWKAFAEAKLKEFKNIIFYGSFKSPDDLQEIYSKIDINVVCYNAKDRNVKIAEPNKLYESIFFNTPIIVSKNTYLEKRVKELEVGFSIDASNDDEIAKFVEGLTLDEISVCAKKAENINNDDLIYFPELYVKRLKELLSVRY